MADSGPGSLRDAITCANNSPGLDAISFTVTGTIDLLTALPDITDDLYVNGPGESQLTVRRSTASGTPNFRVFKVATAGEVTFSGLSISNGNATDTDTRGGGILNDSGGTVNVINSAITDNSASGVGAGIYNNNGTINITNSTLCDNTADNPFNSGLAGAIYNEVAGTVNVMNSTFCRNTARGGNAGSGLGGAIYNRGVTTIENSDFSGNAAVGNPANGNEGTGGAVFNRARLTIKASSFSNNSATGGSFGACNALGGGIYNLGLVDLIDSTFSANTATAGLPRADAVGGGILNDQDGDLNVINSTFIGNSAYGGGGGNDGEGVGGAVANLAGRTNIVNTTLTNNSATGVQSGINFGGSGGGGLWNLDGALGSVALVDTIVANSMLSGNCRGGSPTGGIISVPTEAVGSVPPDLTTPIPCLTRRGCRVTVGLPKPWP